MPTPNWYPTQADLERKVGGAYVLVELSGSSTSVADSTFVDACLASGRGRVRGAIMVKHAPETLDILDSETVVDIKRMAVIFSAQAAWSDGSGNQAIPINFPADLEWADAEAEKIATGRRFLGGATGQPRAALSQVVDVVDSDPLGCRVSINGFKRGFR